MRTVVSEGKVVRKALFVALLSALGLAGGGASSGG